MEAPKNVMRLAIPPTTKTYIRAHLNTLCALRYWCTANLDETTLETAIGIL